MSTGPAAHPPPNDPTISPHLAATFTGPAGRALYAVAFAPEGDMMASADAGGLVHLWDVASGGLAKTFADPGSRGAIGVDFCPNGELLAAADGNGQVHLWDVVEGALA